MGLSFSDCKREEHSIYVHRMLAVKDERLPDGKWKVRQFELVDFLKGGSDPRIVFVSQQGFDIIDIKCNTSA